MMALLLLLPLAVIGCALAAASFRSLAVGAGLAVLTCLAAALAVEPIGLTLMGFHLYLEDLVGSLLLLVAAARFLSRPSLLRRPLPWIPFAGAAAVAFLLGAAVYGIKAAGLEYRSFFPLCAVSLYCASFPIAGRRMARLVAIWLAGAAALTLLACFRWSAGLLHLGMAAQWSAVGGGSAWRVLNAAESLYLGQAFLMLLYLRRRARSCALLSLCAGLLAITVLLLQHRSVWVATALAWAVMAWHERYFLRFARAAFSVAALLLAASWCLPERSARANPVMASLFASVQEPFVERSTFSWRVGLWSEYLLEYAALPSWRKAVGAGLGSPGLYRIGEQRVMQSPHNYFIFILNRAGLLGLLTLLAACGALYRRLRGTGGCGDYLGMLLTLGASQLVYCTVYSPSLVQGLLVGAGFGIASGKVVRHAG